MTQAEGHEGGEDAPAPTSPPTRSVVQNIAALLVSQTATWAISTLVIWIVPRYIDPTGLGQWRLATSITGIMSVVAALGTGTFLTVRIAQEPGITRGLVRRVLRLRAGVFAALVPIAAAFVWIGPYGARTIEVIAIAGGAAVFSLAASAYIPAMYGLQEMGWSSKVDVVTKLMSAVTVLVTLALGGRVIALSWVLVANALVYALASGLALRRCVRARPQRPFEVAARALLRLCVPFMLADATLVVYQQVDTIVMSLLVDEKAIGWYSAADTLFGTSLFIPTIVMTALLPAIVERHERAPDEVPALLRRSFSTLLLVGVPVGLGIVVVSDSFVPLLFGHSYAPAADVFAVYGVVVVLACQTILLGRFALATGRIRYWTKVMLVATLLSFPIDVVLVPWTDRRYHNGAIGGALAYIVTETFIIVAGIVGLAPHLADRAMLGRVLRCLAGGGAMLAVGWPLRHQLFVVSGVAALAAYVVVIVVLRTASAEERELIRRAFARFVPRARLRA